VAKKLPRKAYQPRQLIGVAGIVDPNAVHVGDAAGGDLSGTYPNPSVVDDSHSHSIATLTGVVPSTRNINTTAPLTGGGNLSADRTLGIDDFLPSGPGHARGAVPTPGAVAGTGRYLREDATWQTPPGSSSSSSTPGPRGRDGERGARGRPIPGAAGQQGAAGAAGTNGTNGQPLRGRDGNDGRRGRPIPGRDGAAGTNGTNGAAGGMGPPGRRGRDGPRGRRTPLPAGFMGAATPSSGSMTAVLRRPRRDDLRPRFRPPGDQSRMMAATASLNGRSGLVPRPAAGDQIKVLLGDGIWSTLSIFLDAALGVSGSDRGSIIYRGAAGWAMRGPGTSGFFLMSNGLGADPTYAAVPSASTSQAGTVTLAEDFEETANEVIRADDIRTKTHLFKKRHMQLLPRFNTTTIDAVGMAAPAYGGSGIQQAILGTTYTVVRFLANAGVNSDSYYLDTAGIVRIGFDATCGWMIQTGTVHTNIRMWLGLTSANLSAIGTPTTELVAAFRYDTGVDTANTNWRAVTCDGASVTTTDTGVNAAVNSTGFRFIIITSASSIKFYINEVLVATHTTSLPGNTVGHQVAVRTLDATNKRIEWGRSFYFHSEFGL
jgi:hypothetical protein